MQMSSHGTKKYRSLWVTFSVSWSASWPVARSASSLTLLLSLLLRLLLCLPMSARAVEAARAVAPPVVFAAASLRTALDPALALWQTDQGPRVNGYYAAGYSEESWRR